MYPRCIVVQGTSLPLTFRQIPFDLWKHKEILDTTPHFLDGVGEEIDFDNKAGRVFRTHRAIIIAMIAISSFVVLIIFVCVGKWFCCIG